MWNSLGYGFSLAAILLAAISQPVQAIDEFGDLKIINRLPVTNREIESAFRTSRANMCEVIPAGEPLEIKSFTSILTSRDRRESQKRRVMIPSSRRNLFSVGLEFEASDRAALPALARGPILDYVGDHFLQVQGRVRRDLLDRKLYYHHRPLAITAQFRGSRVTQKFEPVVSNTVQEFHGLGLFLREKPRILKPEMFRTLVLIFRTELLQPGFSRTKESFEFAVVRGRERESISGPNLQSHVFVTTDDRTQLHYLRANDRTTSPSRTSILGRVSITRFDSTGLYPKESAVRSYRLDDQRTFPISRLDDYCEEQSLQGGFVSNVSDVLDAIIERRITD